MKDYPRKVYISTSWHQADSALSTFVVEALAKTDLTVVGDHKDYQQDDPFDRPWTTRVRKLVADCSAVVAILPKRDNIQTTSPYMFPELLAAAEHNLPLLLFAHQGVAIARRDSVIVFGGNASNPAPPSAIFGADPMIDVNDVTSLDLGELSHLAGPYQLPGTENLDLLIDDLSRQMKRVAGAFVFNILPFSLQHREHLEISKAVFEETGLPCRIALDGIGESQGMREQWKATLQSAEFAIADFSQLRDACLFEAGIIVGLRTKLFILSRRSAPKLPYGLDDVPLIVYRSLDELRELVKSSCCAEYKRKVYNLDPQFLPLESNRMNGWGIPPWFMRNPSFVTTSSKLSISCWSASAALALALWAILVWTGSEDSLATLISLVLAILFGLGSQVRRLKAPPAERVA